MSDRIVHLITGLEMGGAESMLLKLCRCAVRRGDVWDVVSLGPPGAVSPMLSDLGISVVHMGASGPKDMVWKLPRLARILRARSPALVQGWMYHGNVIAQLCAIGMGIPVVWNIRSALHRPDLLGRTTRNIVKLGARTSRFADGIVFNSKTGLRQHVALGYCPNAARVIPNGFDQDRFSPDPTRRMEARTELGISDSENLVLSVGRAHPMKGHRILLRAIAQIVGRRDDCRFVIAGRDVGWDREPFQEFGSLAKLGDRIILLPQTDETAGLMAAADIFVNPSLTEGFPNVVAEAMLCGVPVVATNVGDCDLIVENHGSIVKPDDPDALADSMEFWLNQDSNTREAVGLRGRESIMRRFSIDRIADQYFELYRQLLARPGPAQQRDQ